ncbi:hypothetical protein ABH935_003427 [Catenulispora sp. GAS73]
MALVRSRVFLRERSVSCAATDAVEEVIDIE